MARKCATYTFGGCYTANDSRYTLELEAIGREQVAYTLRRNDGNFEWKGTDFRPAPGLDPTGPIAAKHCLGFLVHEAESLLSDFEDEYDTWDAE